MRGRKKTFTRTFTLVELLVVAAIVSILAAMLLPMLRTSLGEARRVTCASQLRQGGLLLDQYCDQYRNYYPDIGLPYLPYSWTKSAGYPVEANTWQEVVGQLYLQGYPTSSGDWGGGRYGIFKCPSSPREISPVAGWGKDYGCDYGRNIKLKGGNRLMNRARQRRPVVCIADKLDSANCYDCVWDQSTVSPRHNGRANVHFTDGHVTGDPAVWRTTGDKIPWTDQ